MVVREHFQVITPDQSLRTCKGRPAKPVLKDDRDTAQLISDLDARGQDCADKLTRTWESIDSTNAAATKANEAQGK